MGRDICEQNNYKVNRHVLVCTTHNKCPEEGEADSNWEN